MDDSPPIAHSAAMQLTDMNRAHRIGANSLLVSIGPFTLVIDAGLDPQTVGLEATPDFDLIGDLVPDAILLTHCHLDHLGSLPLLHRRYPATPILTSRSSAQLAARMLRNSANVMRRQAQEQGIKEYPLYGFGEITQMENLFTVLPWEKAFQLRKGGQSLSITLYRAGHITGAASVLLEYQHRRIFFTADVSFDDTLTIKGASLPQGPFDTLVTETTRGASATAEDYNRTNEVQKLVATFEATLQRGGSVLVPAFALGRMQELLAIIHEARQQGALSPCPVFCSGLGVDLVNYFDTISRKTHDVRFSRRILKTIGMRPLSKPFTPGRNPPEKGIYVLSSGMMVEHTPSYQAAAAMLDHAQNSVCFVGYCDPATPGGQLLEANEGQRFSFEKLDYIAQVRAPIHRFDLSGHARREELIDFALHADPRAIVLTHGDPPAREWFAKTLAELEPGKAVLDPEPGITYSV